MYKVFFNRIPLSIIDSEYDRSLLEEKRLMFKWNKQERQIENLIEDLVSPHVKVPVYLVTSKVEKAIAVFEKQFKIIEAAGGVVEDESKRILFIHRRGYWDLPKGKIDKGEEEKQAAVREVIEETGIQNVELLEKLLTTRHVYRTKNHLILKPSHWYRMKTVWQKTIPQLEEDILKCEWLRAATIKAQSQETYPNILEVLDHV